MQEVDLVRPGELTHLVVRGGDGQTLCGENGKWWEHQPMCRECLEVFARDERPDDLRRHE